jgi:hypothetical protein
MAERAIVDVPSPPGGWGAPWPNLAEIGAVLSHETWTLVGGLMTQLHGIRAATNPCDLPGVGKDRWWARLPRHLVGELREDAVRNGLVGGDDELS